MPCSEQYWPSVIRQAWTKLITQKKQIKLHGQLLLSPDGAASSQSDANTTTCTSLKLGLSLKLIS